MTIQFTARHFKARPELQQIAESAVEALSHIFDGIVSADVVLEQEQHGDGKIAEIGLLVAGDKLFAKDNSNDFVQSINACTDKLERQLQKYKDRIHANRHPHERPEFTDTDVIGDELGIDAVGATGAADAE